MHFPLELNDNSVNDFEIISGEKQTIRDNGLGQKFVSGIEFLHQSQSEV